MKLIEWCTHLTWHFFVQFTRTKWLLIEWTIY